jgi:ATP-binding cassette subfamily C protein LapB
LDDTLTDFASANEPALGSVLVSCLEFVARRLNKTFSRRSVLDGLPLEPGQELTPRLFQRAAARLGLTAKLFERAPSSVPAILLPCIVLLKDGQAAVLINRSRNRRKFQVVFPNISDKPKWLSTRQLDRDSEGYVFYLIDDATDSDPLDSATTERRPTGHWFWRPMLRMWPSWIQIAFAAFIINLLGLATPIFVMNVYDRVIPNLAIPTLWALSAGVAIALIFEMTLRQLRTVVLDQAAQRVDMKVSADLFEHAIGASMETRQEATGALANRIRDFDSVKDFFASASLIAIVDLVFVFVFILLLWLIVGPLAFVPLGAIPVVIAATLLLQFPLSRSVRHAQTQASSKQGVLVESLSAVETVKTIGAEGTLQRRWEEAVVANARFASRVRFWSSLAVHFTTGVQQAVSILIIIWGVFLVAEGKITIGGLIAANILGSRILAPLGNIAMTIARAQQAFQAMRGISRLMQLPVDRAAIVKDGRSIEDGSIEFQQVDFAYPNAPRDVLQGLSFRIEPGQRVGIVGRVGSGKSTIGRLIAGLYEPKRGIIRIGGAEIRSYESAELRSAVGLVLQDPTLFTGTLRENIVIGNPTASEREIVQAARISGVSRFSDSHPLGMQMPIGEAGRYLSGGQRQAVSLARTILRQPKIVFLDEPSGAMDSTTENQLVSLIDAWIGTDTTLIVSTHRLPFLSLVNRVIVVDDGRIVADGKRDDVLKALQGDQGSTS